MPDTQTAPPATAAREYAEALLALCLRAGCRWPLPLQQALHHHALAVTDLLATDDIGAVDALTHLHALRYLVARAQHAGRLPLHTHTLLTDLLATTIRHVLAALHTPRTWRGRQREASAWADSQLGRARNAVSTSSR